MHDIGRRSGVHEAMIAARPAAILRISGLASAVTGQPLKPRPETDDGNGT